MAASAPLANLKPGMAILIGGDRVVHVSEELPGPLVVGAQLRRLRGCLLPEPAALLRRQQEGLRRQNVGSVVDAERGQVRILAIGVKERNRVFLGGEEVEL